MFDANFNRISIATVIKSYTRYALLEVYIVHRMQLHKYAVVRFSVICLHVFARLYIATDANGGCVIGNVANVRQIPYSDGIIDNNLYTVYRYAKCGAGPSQI